MPKVLILPHYHYESAFDAFLEDANATQADFRFYLLPPDDEPESPLRKSVADYLELLPFLENKKKRMGLATKDLLIAFYDGVITATNHGFVNLFMAGSHVDDPHPCTAVASLRFISWGILEQKYDYSLQRHALFHLVVCALIGSYSRTPAHRETYGCLLDFDNRLGDFNRKLQLGYYLCSDSQSGCFHAIQQERYGNSIIRLCSALRGSIDQKRLNIVIKELVMGNKFENISNSTIINQSLVENAFNQIQKRIDESTANALITIAEEVERSQNAAAGALLDSFMTEVKEEKPNKSKLRQCWEGLLAVLPNLATLADAGAKVAKLFT
jgi:hypothetical protein